MAKILTKLRELRNADVRYISLVDRAATRIPFRVLKRNEEEEFMDLTRIFKSDQKPEITAVVVRDNTDANIVTTVKQALSQVGFSVDKVNKSDDTLVYSQVEKQPEGAVLVRLSEDIVLAVKGMGKMPTTGTLSELAAKDGFYSGVNISLGVLQDKVNSALVSGDDSKKIASDVTSLVNDFRDYTSALVESLPVSAFKAEAAIRDIVQKDGTPVDADGDIDPGMVAHQAAAESANSVKEHRAADAYHSSMAKKHKAMSLVHDAKSGGRGTEAEKASGDAADKFSGHADAHQAAADAHFNAASNFGKTSGAGSSTTAQEASKKARSLGAVTKFEVVKADSTTLNGLDDLLAQAPKHIAEDEWGKMSPVDKISWMKSWMESNAGNAGPSYSGAGKDSTTPGKGGSLEDSQFTQPLALGLKAEIEKLAKAVQSIATKVDGVTTKVDGSIAATDAGLKALTTKVNEITTKQDGQQKVLDEVVTKAETLSSKLTTTVAAQPRAEDTPAISLIGARIKKSEDDDPRTGSFDTAFLPKRSGRR